MLVLCVVIATPLAVLTARAEASFGPHEAVYSVTTDAAVDVDFGPLGSLLLPADELLPLGLGVHVEVGEIPVEYGMEDATVDALGGDVEAYATLLSDPGAQGRTVAIALAQNAVLRAVLMGAGLFAAIAVVRGLLGSGRRSALLTAAPPPGSTAAHLPEVLTASSPRLRMTALATAVSVLAGAFTVPLQPDREIRGDPAFLGTPLAGAQVTGRLSGVIDEAAQTVADMLGDNEDFYAAVQTSLATTWNQRPRSPRWHSGELGALGPRPGGEAAEAIAEEVEGEPGAGQDPDADPDELAQEDVATIVWTSDLHCQPGMSRSIAAVVEWSDADVFLDSGDITMTGTDAENVCLDSVAQALPGDVPAVFVKGNHDSEDTVRRAKEVGWTVLEGEVAEVEGIRFYGDSDPRRTVFPSGDVLERGETGEEFTQRMTAGACAADADLLLLHDPRHAEPALANGCLDYGLHGHWHRRVEPESFGRGVRAVNSTTGGALADALTPGPLKMPAELSILRFDRATGQPVDLQYITVGMDRSVEYSEWVPFPEPRPQVALPPEEQEAVEE